MLELTGKDRLAFLNNLLTNQTWDKASKTGLAAGTGVYAYFLNLKGRIVADMNVLELGERTLLEMDVRMVETLRKAFDKYLFAEQVTMSSLVGQVHRIGGAWAGGAERVGGCGGGGDSGARGARVGGGRAVGGGGRWCFGMMSAGCRGIT